MKEINDMLYEIAKNGYIITLLPSYIGKRIVSWTVQIKGLLGFFNTVEIREFESFDLYNSVKLAHSFVLERHADWNWR